MYSGPQGRILALNYVLHLDKWTNNSLPNGFPILIQITPEYRHLLTDLPDYTTIIDLQDHQINAGQLENELQVTKKPKIQ